MSMHYISAKLYSIQLKVTSIGMDWCQSICLYQLKCRTTSSTSSSNFYFNFQCWNHSRHTSNAPEAGSQFFLLPMILRSMDNAKRVSYTIKTPEHQCSTSSSSKYFGKMQCNVAAPSGSVLPVVINVAIGTYVSLLNFFEEEKSLLLIKTREPKKY